MDASGAINTRDIGAAVAALRSGRCTRLYGSNARWGDAGIARLADALAAEGGGAGARAPEAQEQDRVGADVVAREVAVEGHDIAQLLALLVVEIALRRNSGK